MPSPLVFFQIATADPAASRAFYEQLFDWTFEEGGTPGVGPAIDARGPGDFDVRGSFIQLPPAGTPFASLFFRVNDLWATVPKAESLGAKVVVPIIQIPGGTHIAIV